MLSISGCVEEERRGGAHEWRARRSCHRATLWENHRVSHAHVIFRPQLSVVQGIAIRRRAQATERSVNRHASTTARCGALSQGIVHAKLVSQIRTLLQALSA